MSPNYVDISIQEIEAGVLRSRFLLYYLYLNLDKWLSVPQLKISCGHREGSAVITEFIFIV